MRYFCELFHLSKKVWEGTHKNYKSCIEVVELEAVFPCLPFTPLPLYIVLLVLLFSKHLEKNIFLQLVYFSKEVSLHLFHHMTSAHIRALSMSFLPKVSAAVTLLQASFPSSFLASPAPSSVPPLAASPKTVFLLLRQEDHSLRLAINYRTYGNCYKYI